MATERPVHPQDGDAIRLGRTFDPKTERKRLVFSLDGLGVVADEPLVFGEGMVLRVHLTERAESDMSIYVADGCLHVSGMQGTLVMGDRLEPHRLEIRCVVPSIGLDES